jgi:hypothetical protein
VLADSTDESNETATLTLSNASNASISDATGTLTITDDDDSSDGSIIVRQASHSGSLFDVIDLANITVTIDGNSVTPSPSSIELTGNGTRSETISLENIPASGTLTMNFTYSANDKQSGSGAVDANEGPIFDFSLTTGGIDYDATTITNKQNDSNYIGSKDSVSKVIEFDYEISGSSLSLTNVEDPIIVDLGTPGIEIGNNPSGTNFDLNVDGFAELLTWPGGEDALLVLDYDGSGAIEDGTEVVSPRFQNGYYSSSVDALTSLDTNADGVINCNDDQFDDLMLWIDQDHDGVSQSGELYSLADKDIVSFNLDASSTGDQVNGRVITAQGSVGFTDGEIGTYVAVSLRELGGRTGVDSTENLVMDLDGSNANAGESHVVFGGNFTSSVTHLSTSSADVLVGGLGNDVLGGGGGADELSGGAGDDDLRIADLSFQSIDGGAGNDTLTLTGDLSLDLTTTSNLKITNVEKIDLNDTGANTLTLNLSDVLDISDTTDQLLIDGGSDDAVVATDDTWTSESVTEVDGNTYAVFSIGGAQLLIDTDIGARDVLV